MGVIVVSGVVAGFIALTEGVKRTCKSRLAKCGYKREE